MAVENSYGEREDWKNENITSDTSVVNQKPTIPSRSGSRPPIPRKPIFGNSFRNRQVSQELNEVISQRAGSRESHSSSNQSATVGQTNHDRLKEIVDSPAGFEDSFIDDPFNETQYSSYKVLCDFDAIEYCRMYNIIETGKTHLPLILPHLKTL